MVTRACGQRGGGLERLSYELIQALSARTDVQAEVIQHRGGRTTSPLFVFLSLPGVLAAARRADVIHLGDPLLAFSGWLVKKIYGKPVAVNVHGLDIVYPGLLYQTYLKFFFRSFDAYFSISRYVNKLLVQHRTGGAHVVINPGVSDRFYDPGINRRQLADAIGVKNKKRVILLTTGRLVKRKGQAWFVTKVLPRLPAHFVYVIAGPGPEEKSIKKAIAQHGLTGRVVLTGAISEDLLKLLYNGADAFIQPNIKVDGDVEGFGLVLVEAALCNVPVFAARLEGMTDALLDGKLGTLLESGNAKAWGTALANTPFIRTDTRTKALARFSWDKVAGQYYHQLAKCAGGPSSLDSN